MGERYQVLDFFTNLLTIMEAEENEHNQENPPMDPAQQQADPNVAASSNPHDGDQQQEPPQKQANKEIAKITTPFSILSGKQIQNMSLKKLGPNSAELKMDLKGYGPVTISWVNNTITLTDPKTGRVINL